MSRGNAHHSSDEYWLFGKHPVLSALQNPSRIYKKLLVTHGSKKILEKYKLENLPKCEIVNGNEIDNILKDNTHQGFALRVKKLQQPHLKQLVDAQSSLLVLLDHVTDPHNIGAIIRSTLAFGGSGIIMTKQNAPDESNIICKSASGAFESLPFMKVPNLVTTMKFLKESGYWIVGLDVLGHSDFTQVEGLKKVAVVLGAEGEGMRKTTMNNCDFLIRLPISDSVQSINVSNAAAIALYELSKNNTL